MKREELIQFCGPSAVADDITGTNARERAGKLPAWVSFAELAAMVDCTIGETHPFADERFTLRRLGRREALHRQGDPFSSLYVVRAGVFKSVTVNDFGAEQVLAFPMPGDVSGVDGIGAGVHATTTVALVPAAAVIVPYGRLSRLAGSDPIAEQLLCRFFHIEMTHRLGMISLLGTLRAEARVAAFLLAMGERLRQLGFSRSYVRLPMTRGDISRYLGVRLETVSRAISSLAEAGLIEVGQRSVTIRKRDALASLVEQAPDGHQSIGARRPRR